MSITAICDEFDNVLQFVTEGDETVADYVAIEG